jgi:hypothetical protein
VPIGPGSDVLEDRFRAERSDRRPGHVRPEFERYFERFSDMLRRACAPVERIDALRDRFRNLPAGREHLPCPRCFVHHRYESLATLTFTGQFHALRCRRCGSTVVVETGI